ncbi:APC family permease [Mycoplasmopsis lipofaciens]|uniref:APC family permease n=1 Tax=Mycoplasmopsis lipofaciens TaxID=114884 RepID=UPI000A7F88D9|nr:amino acid permease [Mycoplasmopsis lipofaciens]
MKKTKVKKIGFFFALTMLIGSIVGIGIFFKNAGIRNATQGNGISWLLTWIVAGIISLCAAISFSEISTIKNTKISGIGNWATRVMNKKFGYFITFNYTFLYGPILIFMLSFFTAEAAHLLIFQISGKLIPYAYLPLTSLILFSIVFFSLIINIKISGHIQKITTIIKFIPLIVVIILGISMHNTNNAGGTNAFVNKAFKWSDLKNMIIALPSALFAYDAFLSVGSTANNIENSEKKVPLIVLLGMIVVITTYCLIAIASILHDSSIVQQIFNNIFKNKNFQKAFNIVFWLLLFISAFGVLNGFTTAYAHDINNVLVTNISFGMNKIKNKLNLKQLVVIYFALIYLLVWIIGSSILWITKSDKLLDGISNLPTFIFFNFYGLIILFYLINRKNINTKKMNKIAYYIVSILAVIGCLSVNAIYLTNLTISIINKNNSGWGIFYSGSYNVAIYIELVIYLVYVALIIILPYLNLWLVKKIEKRDLYKEFEFENKEIDVTKLVFTNYKLK